MRALRDTIEWERGEREMAGESKGNAQVRWGKRSSQMGKRAPTYSLGVMLMWYILITDVCHLAFKLCVRVCDGSIVL